MHKTLFFMHLHQQGCPYRIPLSELGDGEPVNMRSDEVTSQPSRRRLGATA